MTFFKKPPRYHTLLLTLWEERSQNLASAAVWRFRLETPQTGDQRGFATLRELTAFLEEQMCGGNELKDRQTRHLDLRPKS